MARISEAPKQQSSLVNNGTEVKLTNTNVFQFLQVLIDKGYKASKTLTIRDGALLQKYHDILVGSVKPTDTDPSHPEIYKSILNAIAKANEEGAYTCNDAAVLDRLLTYINENMAEKFELSQEEQGTLEL